MLIVHGSWWSNEILFKLEDSYSGAATGLAVMDLIFTQVVIILIIIILLSLLSSSLMNWSSNIKITSFTHDWSDFYLRANPYLRWVNLRSLWCCVFHDLWGFFEGLRGLCGGEGWGCVCEIVGYGYGDSGLQPWLLSRGPDCATKIVLIAPFPNKLKFQNNCTTSVCFTFPQCAFSNVTSVHLDQVKFRNNYTASLTILVKFDQSSHPGFTPRSQSWTDITLNLELILRSRSSW